ncbi:hypothetical protein BN1263320077 [Stenotrophomonas indicatrix]|nr:hypothetical protein BN1263320077 [Stenotrophomonas indicatrix]
MGSSTEEGSGSMMMTIIIDVNGLMMNIIYVC